MAPASVGPLHQAESSGGGGAAGSTKFAPEEEGPCKSTPTPSAPVKSTQPPFAAQRGRMRRVKTMKTMRSCLHRMRDGTGDGREWSWLLLTRE